MSGWTLFALAVGACVLIVIIVGFVDSRRLSRKTGGWSRGRFISTFEERGVDPWDAGAVYDFFREWVGVRDYLVSPQDDLDKDYGIASLDHYDNSVSILEQCLLELPEGDPLWQPVNLAVPSQYAKEYKEWPGLQLYHEPRTREEPLRTVEDVVLWVARVRQQQRSNDEPQLLTPPRLFPYF